MLVAVKRRLPKTFSRGGGTAIRGLGLSSLLCSEFTLNFGQVTAVQAEQEARRALQRWVNWSLSRKEFRIEMGIHH